MLDLQNTPKTIKRPRLLVQAARFGLESYNRERDILRLLDVARPPKLGEAITMLREAEEFANLQRLTDASHYSYARHIELLTALIAETALLDQIAKSRQTK